MSKNTLLRILLTFTGIILLLGLTYLLPLLLQESSQESPVSTPLTGDVTPTNGSESPEIVIQPFKHTITDQGEMKFEITAERAEKYRQNKAFLLKNIQKAVFYGKDRRRFELTAETGHWDESKQMVIVEGNIMCRVFEEGQEDYLELTCQHLNYDINLKTMEGYGNLRANYGQYQTTGEKLTINLNLNLVTIEDNIITQIGPGALNSKEINPGIPIIGRARKAIYHINERVLDYLGSPEIFWGSDSIKAGQFHFDFLNQSFSGINGITADFSLGPSQYGPEPSLKVTSSVIQVDLKQSRINLKDNVAIWHGHDHVFCNAFGCVFDRETNEVQSMRADGEVLVRYSDITANSSSLTVHLPTESAQLSGDAKIERDDGTSIEAMVVQIKYGSRIYMADEQVKMIIPPSKATPSKRSASLDLGLFSMNPNAPAAETQFYCNQAILDENQGHIDASGDIRGYQSDYTFSADSLRINSDPQTREFKSLVATGKVQLSEKGRILTGDALNYSGSDRRAVLSGNATFWEASNSIRADRFEYLSNTKMIEAFGNVAGVLTSTTPMSRSAAPGEVKSKPTETHVSSNYASFDQKQNLAVFRENVLIIQEMYELKAQNVSIFIDPVTKTIKSADAVEKIELKQETFHATGSSLTYSAGDSIIVLKGSEAEKCRIWQGERGAEAEEIKVFVNENRFTIEKGLSVIMPSELGGTLK